MNSRVLVTKEMINYLLKEGFTITGDINNIDLLCVDISHKSICVDNNVCKVVNFIDFKTMYDVYKKGWIDNLNIIIEDILYEYKGYKIRCADNFIVTINNATIVMPFIENIIYLIETM